MSSPEKTDASVPPPLIYFGCLGIGLAVDYVAPLPLLPQALQYGIGIPVIVFSFVLFGLVLREFARSNTSIDHRKPTTEIITTGPFRYSRNPVYVSLTLLLVGVAIAVDSLWALLMAIPAVLITQRFVIRREEAFLTEKFGAAYRSYQESVRRWI